MADKSQQTIPSPPLRVVFISSYPPRECGIATYTEDVIRAIDPHAIEPRVIAMERPNDHFTYDEHVIGNIVEDDPQTYIHAAELINRGNFDVVSLQHEFGIYGGEERLHLLSFLDSLHIPVVVTLHTLPLQPSPQVRNHIQFITDRSKRVVLMNGLAPDILTTVYGVDFDKIVIIHHGSPVPTKTRDAHLKSLLGLDGQSILSTFGLISPSKGLEYSIKSMPKILEQCPDTVYCILGQTHPIVREEDGESYRGELENMAFELGVLPNVKFLDKYLTKEEVMNYLLATDVYVTPYLNLDQVTSGTLAYAIGMGCPIVTTPYLHAKFLLSQGEGILVSPGNAEEIADACINILTNPDLQQHMEAVNWELGQSLLWPHVGEDYIRIFISAAS